MKVAKLVAPNKIEIFDEAIPQSVKAGQAIVRVKACGICGTDVHIFPGQRADVALPRVMGHELSGEVVMVASDVENVKVGDRVVLDPVVACGECEVCKAGHPNVCATVKCFGVQMDGGFADYITVDAKQLYTFSDKITFEQAALVEPFSVAANICDRTQVTKEDSVMVFGAGTIGLCIVQALKGIGAKVLVSDVVDSKLAVAKEFGADVVVNSKTQNLDEEVAKFAPIGASVVIDAVGIAPLFEQSIKYAMPTGRVAVIGFDAKPAQIPNVLITKKELTLVGSRMNCYKFPTVVKWFEEGMVDPQKMISKEYNVDDIQKAFEDTIADGQNCIKTIIKF